MSAFDGTSRLLRSVLGKTLFDQRRGILGWGLAFAAFSLMMTSVYPSFADQADQFEQLAASYPEGLKAFLGGLDDLATPEGFIRAELLSAMFPIMLLVYAIGRAADTLAGEEERGALDVTLSQPVTRRRVLLGKAGGLALGIVSLAGIGWAALTVGSLVFGMGLHPGRTAGAFAMLALLGLFFAALAFAFAAARGRKAFAVGAAAGIAALTYLANGLARLSEGLEAVRYLSPFYYYEAADTLRADPEPWGALVLAAGTFALMAIAVLMFERRDIGT